MSFETIQEFYQLGMWSVADLEKLVGAGVITSAQFTEITGQAYPEPTTAKEAPTPTSTVKQGIIAPASPTESPKEQVATTQTPVKSLLD